MAVSEKWPSRIPPRLSLPAGGSPGAQSSVERLLEPSASSETELRKASLSARPKLRPLPPSPLIPPKRSNKQPRLSAKRPERPCRARRSQASWHCSLALSPLDLPVGG